MKAYSVLVSVLVPSMFTRSLVHSLRQPSAKVGRVYGADGDGQAIFAITGEKKTFEKDEKEIPTS